ncbi:MAG: peroxide stress protein YaaA [Pseudomonadales bacterium]|nr:peroxide stress protein YaaA [Pseudomonadales bacterium]
MLLLISPAKTLDFETKAKTDIYTEPSFLKDTKLLIKDLKKLSSQDLTKLMGISETLADLNSQRFKDWKAPFTQDNAKQALLAFKGDVYTGLDAESFKANDFKFAQKHLRILSGLYGVLRPLDLIQPYRLEMGTKFANARGQNLYGFWDNKVTETLNNDLKSLKSESVINLASNEYFKVVKPKLLQAEVFTPVFKDYKNGEYKMISFFAKKARGLMSAYAIKNRITDPKGLLSFDLQGYGYSKKLSTEKEFVFTRKQT